jgi:hypothetical protein
VEKVFISHSSNDRARAEDLCRSLEERGVPCWMAPRDITPGAVYGGAIVEAIDNCRGLVVLLSQSSNVSGHVAREVERAANKGKHLFPVRLYDVTPSRELEYFLSMPQSVDLIDPPFNRQIDRLAAALTSNTEDSAGKPNAAGIGGLGDGVLRSLRSQRRSPRYAQIGRLPLPCCPLPT